MRRAFAIVRIENRLADRTGRYATLFAGCESTRVGFEKGAADKGARSRITTVWETAESYRELGVSLIGLA